MREEVGTLISTGILSYAVNWRNGGVEEIVKGKILSLREILRSMELLDRVIGSDVVTIEDGTFILDMDMKKLVEIWGGNRESYHMMSTMYPGENFMRTLYVLLGHVGQKVKWKGEIVLER